MSNLTDGMLYLVCKKRRTFFYENNILWYNNTAV